MGKSKGARLTAPIPTEIMVCVCTFLCLYSAELGQVMQKGFLLLGFSSPGPSAKEGRLVFLLFFSVSVCTY